MCPFTRATHFGVTIFLTHSHMSGDKTRQINGPLVRFNGLWDRPEQALECPSADRDGPSNSQRSRKIWRWFKLMVNKNWVGEFTTHFRLPILVVGLVDVHWGYDLGFAKMAISGERL